MASTETKDASGAPLKALQLLGKWTRIAQQGALPIGGMGGCSCCAGWDFLPVSSLELELLDFLDGRHGGESPIGTLLRAEAGYKPNEAGRLADLLKAIATGKASVAEEARWTPFFDDLQAAVESLDDIASGRMV